MELLYSASQAPIHLGLGALREAMTT